MTSLLYFDLTLDLLLQNMFSSIVYKLRSIVHKPMEEKSTIPAVIYDEDAKRLKETIYDQMKTIQDPEKPVTLEDLNVVYEDGVVVRRNFDSTIYLVDIEFSPTVPHCSLASLIGLCIREKLQRNLTERMKLRIYVKEGTHSAGGEVNKQINDKERVAAALENPSLLEVVERCIKEE